MGNTPPAHPGAGQDDAIPSHPRLAHPSPASGMLGGPPSPARGVLEGPPAHHWPGWGVPAKDVMKGRHPGPPQAVLGSVFPNTNPIPSAANHTDLRPLMTFP